ncbi:hypothetical protein HPP92_010078 [Vanilla planifolia]|uniref:Uncharacterized protein n=1 Tax=Vanilla planifolia TaxID=51239 RepID=A0A835R4G8_VANPL|nr:hypothetical protein HPP92_010078 [Vanilla planifolia]
MGEELEKELRGGEEQGIGRIKEERGIGGDGGGIGGVGVELEELEELKDLEKKLEELEDLEKKLEEGSAELEEEWSKNRRRN